MRFVFLHGGPGFNSFAEQAILGPRIHALGHEMAFWNEPSPLRPLGDPFDPVRAFEHWVASAERCTRQAAALEPVHLIAHSCSTVVAIEMARRHPASVASLTLLASGADVFATFIRVLHLAHQDLLATRPEVAAAIADCRSRSRRVFDDAMRDGLVHVLQDDRLFTHYWADPDQFQASMAAMARPDAQFDVESFFAVLGDYGERGDALLSTAPVAVPTLALFGAEDPVTLIDEQRQAIEAAIPHARFQELHGCSHYLHLDKPELFVELLTEWASASGRGAERAMGYRP